MLKFLPQSPSLRVCPIHLATVACRYVWQSALLVVLIRSYNLPLAAQLDFHLRALGHPLPINHPVELVWRSLGVGASLG